MIVALAYTVAALACTLGLVAGLGAAFERLMRRRRRPSLLDADEARARAMSEYYWIARGPESY